MPSFPFRMRRAPVEWGGRLVLAACAAWLGFGAVTQSLAINLRSSAPEWAHRLNPSDGRITALLAEIGSQPEASGSVRIKADQMARLALRQDATAVTAATTLGINALTRGSAATARHWFGYAQQLSRRDLRTQLWAIEDAVVRDDIADALNHYDIALRTSRKAPDLLFPVLASAITMPKVRSALVHTLSSRPIWTAGFIGYAAVNGPNPETTAQLFQELSKKISISDDARAVLIHRLVTKHSFSEAWALYASKYSNVDPHRSRDPQFSINLTAPSVFDWNAINDGGVSGSIQPSTDGGIVMFDAPQSVGGVVLRQAQILPPGNYLLQGRTRDIAQPAGSKPYWSLTCMAGQILGQVDLPDSVQAGGKFEGHFTVPANCPLQYLSLFLRPSDAIDGVRGQIIMARLVPTDSKSNDL